MHTGGVIVLVIILLLIFAGVGWIVFTRVRAQRLGLPAPSLKSYIPFLGSSSSSPYGPPQPRRGGIVGWFDDRIRSLKNRNNRTAAGAYEGQPPGGAGGRRGFGPLDPDEAWDTRVGHEGYYEEQELGLAAHQVENDTSYGGGGGSYPMNLAATPGQAPAGFGGGGSGNADEERGRPRSRAPGGGLAPNPFDDDAEPSNLSLRGVSPRPIDTAVAGKSAGGGAKDDDSPTERKSVFREDV